MASKHSSKSRRARRKVPTSTALAPTSKPSHLSPALVEAIHRERRGLQQVDHALGCLALSLQEGCEPEFYDDPDFSDVARLIRYIVRSIAGRLEPINLLKAEEEASSE